MVIFAGRFFPFPGEISFAQPQFLTSVNICSKFATWLGVADWSRQQVLRPSAYGSNRNSANRFKFDTQIISFVVSRVKNIFAYFSKALQQASKSKNRKKFNYHFNFSHVRIKNNLIVRTSRVWANMPFEGNYIAYLFVIWKQSIAIQLQKLNYAINCSFSKMTLFWIVISLHWNL